jgi:uncharacterized protein YggE
VDQFEASSSQDVLGASATPDTQSGSRKRRIPTTRTLVAGGLALVVVGGVAGFAIPRATNNSRPIQLVAHSAPAGQNGAQITVTGSATVQGTPDTLSFTIGVHNTASTATAALEANNAEVGKLEAALEAKGVAATDLQTSSLDIYENQNSHGVVTGFSVDDDLNVTMHNVSAAGAAIDAGAQAVGNDVSLYGISFSISNESALLAKARAEAMLNARTEASQLAAGAGLTLGSIVKVIDQENSQPQPVFYGAASVPARAGVPINQGTQPISVQVSVVYSLHS